ncbi:MAG TPA: sulfate adenylyltransferase subunit CysN [Bryobacteraceae bacterium]|nr:sulfate adenylyltransferase subunit CysN [Bryobacteraceae bacterium]
MPALMHEAAPDFDLDQFLAQEREKELLRFLTCGSVDDGKSTLIGRLLYDSRNVFEDQIHAAAKASQNRSAGAIDLSLLTDGLRAEREQGITIDVAYRYFATARRKFIIADTPGHEQYTRNMATGASKADLAILLIDARHGVLAQSRRHAFICSLLDIPRYVVAVNKMDLVGNDHATFQAIQAEFSEFLRSIGVPDAYFLPLSALTGDNVVSRSKEISWFEGPSLLEFLETVEIGSRAADTGFRLPVQRVVRPDQFFRGYAGEIASGTIRPGDEVTVLPSGLRSRVERIATFDGDLKEASESMAVTITLADPLDISRGDMLFAGPDAPHVTRNFEAQVVWMNAAPLDPRKRYLVKQTARIVPAEITAIHHRVDMQTLAKEPAATLEMNAIGLVEIATAKPLFFDAYSRNRATGSFIIIDPETNATSGAGMILRPATGEDTSALPVSPAERIARWGHRGFLVRLGNRRGVAESLQRRLFEHGCAVVILENVDPAALKAVERAGLLVLALGETRDRTWLDDEPDDGPNDDIEAAAEIFRRLQSNGVLANPRWTPGEGI